MGYAATSLQSVEYTTVVTGFSSTTDLESHYTLVGKLCTVIFRIVGTSDTTGFTVTLPFPADDTKMGGGANSTYSAIAQITNNGTNAAGWIRTRVSQSNIADVYATAAGGAWTASGTKALGTSLSYYIV